jgi:hypothetical protein
MNNPFLDDSLDGMMLRDFKVKRNPSDFYRWKNYYTTEVYRDDVWFGSVTTNELECDATIICMAIAHKL